MVGISGLSNDFKAAGFHEVTSRFVVIFCKGKCVEYEIENDDVFVTILRDLKFLHRL